MGNILHMSVWSCIIGEVHLKSPSPKLARPMPIGHWAGSGKLRQIRACNGRPFLARFRIGRAWAVMGLMGLGARSMQITLKFDLAKQFLARKSTYFLENCQNVSIYSYYALITPSLVNLWQFYRRFKGQCTANLRWVNEKRAPICPTGSPLGRQVKIYVPVGRIGRACLMARTFGLARAARMM